MLDEKDRPIKLIRIVLLSAVVIILFAMLPLNTSKGKFTALASEDKTADPNKKEDEKKVKKIPRPTHNHPAFKERYDEREEMVGWQIMKRGIKDVNVIDSMLTVPRHAFVRGKDLTFAYNDTPLPIGFGQTISQPYIVAYMTEALKLKPKHKILEIGTGSSYQAAVCAEIVQEVYTIEIIEGLAKSAKDLLKDLGYKNVYAKAGDGYYGWKEKGPFDAIIVTCAAGLVPPPLIEQLKPGGKMILPLGSPYGSQSLVLITKDDKGRIRSKHLLPVRFVPMVGRVTK
ncbi:MAG: protein-L-isoaspartate(D-aspartate) O-methyltransferase [Planctomycetota bacterium]|jgi:protein-L-isoaspartate(D-aspartate) O-methyltransferase